MFRDAALGQEEIHFYFCVVHATIDKFGDERVLNLSV